MQNRLIPKKSEILAGSLVSSFEQTKILETRSNILEGSADIELYLDKIIKKTGAPLANSLQEKICAFENTTQNQTDLGKNLRKVLEIRQQFIENQIAVEQTSSGKLIPVLLLENSKQELDEEFFTKLNATYSQTFVKLLEILGKS